MFQIGAKKFLLLQMLITKAISDLKGKEIGGRLYEQELQEAN